MHEHQEKRIAASREFAESLEQLQDILTEGSQTAESEPQQSDESSVEVSTETKLLEEAAAELDEFLDNI
ncbi:MAG: hypothetical protein F6K14_02530 [Symploca sp. SIO2C1]|nr:hypothetical protein [Symploca sp. SIO2C1]